MYLMGCVYNFCTEHKSLRLKLWVGSHGFRWVQRTPAIAAGLTDHIWTVEDTMKTASGPRPILNRFLLAIIFPAVTLSRVRPHPCGTAPLLSAALDRGLTYGKCSR